MSTPISPQRTTRAISWAFSQKISANAKLVLLRLALEAGDDDKCLLTRAAIAADTSMTTMNVRRVVSGLVDAGLIRVEQITRTEYAFYLLLS